MFAPSSNLLEFFPKLPEQFSSTYTFINVSFHSPYPWTKRKTFLNVSIFFKDFPNFSSPSSLIIEQLLNLLHFFSNCLLIKDKNYISNITEAFQTFTEIAYPNTIYPWTSTTSLNIFIKPMIYDEKLSLKFWRDFIPLKLFPSLSSPPFVISTHLSKRRLNLCKETSPSKLSPRFSSPISVIPQHLNGQEILILILLIEEKGHGF